MRRIPSAKIVVSRAAAAETQSKVHRPGRALAVLAALPMSMRPRMQTGIIAARLRSKAARIPYPVKKLFPRRLLRHRRILHRLPLKRWQALFLKQYRQQIANSPTPREKPPCRPAPDVRRVMWQRQRTMQHPRQEKQRPVRRIIMQELCSPARTARSRRIRSRNRTHIPSRNPIRAAAQRCRIAVWSLLSVQQEKQQHRIRRAVPISRPVRQENRITAAMHKARRYGANPRSSAVPLCSRLTHSEAHRMRPRQRQCQTILHRCLPLRAARHSLSAAQEKVRCSLRIQKRRSSAVPLCRLRTWQARSQQQIIRLRLLLRDPVWQEIRLCHTAAHRQFPHKTVWQENNQILILHPPAIPQELVRGRSNRAVRRIRPRPARQECSARLSAGAIPNPCSRRPAFPRMEIPRSHSRIMFLPSSPAAQCSRPAEPVWMAAPQIGSIRLPQHRLPTAKPVRLRARPRGLMRHVRQNSALRSAQFPHKAAAQKSRYRRLAHKLLLFPPLLPNGRAGNRRPRLLWAA